MHRSNLKFCLAVSLVVGAAGLLFRVHDNSYANDRDKHTGFAVIELFTSEGCSSCPPADRLLSEIAEQARQNGEPIFALSFHVDYWNYIGWTDPYSDATYSERQRAYGQAFNSQRIYTPQMVVNGETEFVGSNRARAQAAIERALKQSQDVSIMLARESVTESKVTVRYEVSELPQGYKVNLALVERDLVQNVKRGENRGRTLEHDNVVRAFQTASEARGLAKFELPAGANPDNCAVIAYVQHEHTMKIIAAEQVSH